jgi:vacuolar-type H+-ATPase subunit I/STV1
MAGNRQGDNGFLDDDRKQLSKLEKALAGQPAEVILRVRDYARTFDLDDDDELFAFMAAIGFLTILVQDAPENWRALFDEVIQDLDRWAEQNRRSFAQLEQYATAANGLAQVLEKAILAIGSANDSRRELKKEMLGEVSKNADLTRQLGKELGSRLKQNDDRLKTLRQKGELAAILAGVGMGAALLLLLVGGGASMRVLGQNKVLKQELAEVRREMGYLLDKANRAECVNGIKPPSDPQCQQYQ